MIHVDILELSEYAFPWHPKFYLKSLLSDEGRLKDGLWRHFNAGLNTLRACFFAIGLKIYNYFIVSLQKCDLHQKCLCLLRTHHRHNVRCYA